MRILVIGGMHGNEPLGPQIVKKLQTSPIEGIHGLIANELAYQAQSRFVEQDMNRAFPGVKKSSGYEHRRPVELLRIAKKYDVVLDFHNTHCANNDCSFAGGDCDPIMFGVSQSLGLQKVVVADYDCMNKYAPNCLSIEISLDSKENDASKWIDRITNLKNTLETGELPDSKTVLKYKFVYRMTLDDKRIHNLEKENLKAFEKLDDNLARNLGVKSPAYPIFIDDAYTPYNYGGILNRSA